MAKYKIVKADDSAVTSNNSRELKRRIKGNKYKKFTAGIYNFLNKKGDVCFQVKYTLGADGKGIKGQQKNKF